MISLLIKYLGSLSVDPSNADTGASLLLISQTLTHPSLEHVTISGGPYLSDYVNFNEIKVMSFTTFPPVPSMALIMDVCACALQIGSFGLCKSQISSFPLKFPVANNLAFTDDAPKVPHLILSL